MFAMKKSIQSVLLASAIASVGGSSAQAQCLLDIFGLGKSTAQPTTTIPGYPYSSNYPVLPPGYPIQGQPVVGGMPYSAGYAGIPQSAISLAAPTNYNTSYFAVPTTYYRPVTTTDPRTGQQVTTMMPCTSYQMQALRSPAWSLGQFVQGGTPTPMVPSAPLPAATSSPGLAPVGTVPTSVTGMVPNAADPNSVPTLPTINPSLPVYGTPVQSSYGNPSTVVNTNPTWNGYNNGVAPATYMPAGPQNSAPIGAVQAGSVPTYSNSYGATSGVYPSDWNTPTNSSNTALPTTNAFSPPANVQSGSVNFNNSTGVYPPLPTDAEYKPAPMFSAEPQQNNPAVNGDPGATEKPVLPPPENTSRFNRQPDPSMLSSKESEGRIQSVVRQPNADMREMSSKSIERVRSSSEIESPITAPQLLKPESKTNENSKGTLGPSLKPIPLPDGFDAEPHWNPSLLNSSDKTASMPPRANDIENRSSKTQPPAVTVADDVRWASFSEKSVQASQQVENGRRPVTTTVRKPESKSRYDADGWKSAK